MKLRYFVFLGMLLLICNPFKSLAQYDVPALGFVFDDSEVARVDIEIAPALLGFILNPNNQESNTEYPADFYFTRTGKTDTVLNVGFRLRGNTSRSAGKKSFKISFNSNVQGQKYKGLEKMNLNGEHNDPSIMRSKICWDLYTSVGIPGSRSNHVEFYINGEYRGLYLNVEHIDEEFLKSRFSADDGNLYKCLYPADLAFLGSDPELYKKDEFGRRTYELKTNEEEDDYSDLAEFISILNNPSVDEFQCKLESVFDVDNYLKVIVMDILVSNWDGPIVNKNNFYLYHNPATDQFVYLPYDLDNTMGVGWGATAWWETDIYNWSDTWGDVDRPIYEVIMSIPEYRNKVSYYFEQYTNEFFNNTTLDPYLDDFLTKLKPFRENDAFAELDYGWNLEAFEKSFDQGLGNHVPLGLKEYIDERNTSARMQLQIMDPLALLEYYDFEWHQEQIDFSLKIEFPWDIVGTVFLNYQLNEEVWQRTPMTSEDDMLYLTSVAHDGIGQLNYYFEVENIAGTLNIPECDLESIPLGLEPSEHLVINELLASNDNDVVDDSGEHEDWIELYNPGDVDLNLSNYYLSDNLDNPGKWQIEGDLIGSDNYYTVWADEDGEQGIHHANFKLSKGGEFLGLFFLKDGVYFVVDSLTFPPQDTDISYGRLPNGTGDFQVLSVTSYGLNNNVESSVIDVIENDNIVIFPNPTSDFLTINIRNIEVKIDQLMIFNAWGQLALEKQFNGRDNISLELHTTTLISGTYFVKIIDINGREKVKRFIYLAK